VSVITADGLQYLADTDAAYDVIYMDAFLKPSAGTDTTGAPLHLKTVQFYQDVQQKLKPGGVVVFNLNPHAKVRDDLQTIRSAFRQTYVFHLPGSRGLVAVGAASAERLSAAELTARAGDLDRRFRTSFSFERMSRRLAD
jgi:spermidine synthase